MDATELALECNLALQVAILNKIQEIQTLKQSISAVSKQYPQFKVVRRYPYFSGMKPPKLNTLSDVYYSSYFWTKSKRNELHQEVVRMKKLTSVLNNEDWTVISKLIGAPFSCQQVKTFWTENIAVDSSEFSPQELEALYELVQDYQKPNWISISEDMGARGFTRRPIQCFKAYKRSLKQMQYFCLI
jgi:hypothetical protein